MSSNVFEVPPGPGVDSRNAMEKGDILETSPMAGSMVSAVVGFKDGHKAFFSPATSGYPVPEQVISSLEAAVFWIDKILGFHLVPATVKRPVNQQDGHLDEVIADAKPAVYYRNWEDVVQPQELQKAAVLDFILDSRDRRKENFLIDEKSRRLWLINNDYFMLLSSFDSRDVLRSAVNRGLTDLPPDMLAAIDKFYSGAPSVIGQAKEKEVLDVLNRARERTKTVLDKKTLNIWPFFIL